MLTLIAALLLPLQDARELIQKLQSDKAGERDDAGRKLKELGDAAIPELESASKGKDPEVAARARALLRAIEIRRKLTPKLLQAIPGVEDRLAAGQWTAVFLKAAALHPSLGTEDVELLAVPALKQALEASEKLEVLGAIVRGEHRSAIPAIVELLKGGPLLLRRRALSALLDFKALEAFPDVVALLDDPDEQVRAMALEALPRLDPKRARPEFLRMLGDRSPMVRRSAVTQLGRTRDKSVAPSLLAALRDQEDTVRFHALGALRSLDLREALPRIADLLNDPSPLVRGAAAQVLPLMGDTERIPDVITLLGDKEPQVRRSAISALESYGATAAAPQITPLLQDLDVQVRKAAAWTLGKLGSKATLPPLARLLEDPEQEIRVGAAAALCRLGSDEGVSVLLKEATELLYLNALRQPELWARLEKKKLSASVPGSYEDTLDRVVRDSGLKLDWPGRPRETRCFGGDWALLDGLRVAIDGTPEEAVLEPDAIRILPREKAIEFWRQWWKAREKK